MGESCIRGKGCRQGDTRGYRNRQPPDKPICHFPAKKHPLAGPAGNDGIPHPSHHKTPAHACYSSGLGSRVQYFAATPNPATPTDPVVPRSFGPVPFPRWQRDIRRVRSPENRSPAPTGYTHAAHKKTLTDQGFPTHPPPRHPLDMTSGHATNKHCSPKNKCHRPIDTLQTIGLPKDLASPILIRSKRSVRNWRRRDQWL